MTDLEMIFYSNYWIFGRSSKETNGMCCYGEMRWVLTGIIQAGESTES